MWRHRLDTATRSNVQISVKRLCATIVLLAASASAQDLSGFERILFPVLSHGQLRGANGTVFRTELNASAQEPVAYYPATVNGGGPSFGLQPAGIDSIGFFEEAPSSAGRLLYFDRTKTGRINFLFNLAVTGPDQSEHTTTLPVVREQQFQSGPSVILGLATAPIYDLSDHPPTKTIGFRARNHVRIYDVDNTGTLAVRVRVTIPVLSAYGPFADYQVRLATRDGSDASYPYYVDLALPDLCITAPTGITCRFFRLTMSIEPSDPMARYWAFASATDNTSGETSLFFQQ
jgi:hypothetical protein